MKSKWASLLQYSAGLAAILVITISGLCLLVVVGVAIVVTKISVFIR